MALLFCIAGMLLSFHEIYLEFFPKFVRFNKFIFVQSKFYVIFSAYIDDNFTLF